MNDVLVLVGRLAGIAGALICLVAGVARLLGNFYLLGFSASTLLQAGMAGLLIGCFALLLARHQHS